MLDMKLQFFAEAPADALIRNKIGDFLNCGTSETPDYQLMGMGFTSLNESPNAQSESVTYIHQVTSSASINGYETEFGYESHLIPSEKAIYALYLDGRDHHVGADAQHEYIRVELFNPIASQDANVEEYTARKFIVSNEVSDYEGDGGEKITVSGTLKAVGDPVLGKFDIISKTFTAGNFQGQYDA